MAESIVQVTEGSGKKLHTNSRVIGANTVEDEVIIQGENYLATYSFFAKGVATTTALSHALQIMAGATLNVRLSRVVVVQRAVAGAVNSLELAIVRLSTAGTGGGAVASVVRDSGDAASGCTGMTLPTVKGTETGADIFEPLWIPLVAAQPVTARLDIRFDNPHEKRWRIGAGTTNGIAFKITTGVATSTVDIYAVVEEANF